MRIALTAGLAFLALAAPASAGRLVATGHDVDHHCAGVSTGNPGQCHYLQVAVDYIRGGAPSPSKPVLVLDRGGLEVGIALDKAFGAGKLPRAVVDPRSPEFATTAFDVNTFSAIIVASDKTCGGCDLNELDSTPDSDAINARAADIAAFYNAGGGILALAGADHGSSAAATATYYRFLPLPVGGVAVSPPFTITPPGYAFGFTDGTKGTTDDVNCCPTHNSFELPTGGQLAVAETDGQKKAETLFTEGTIGASGFVPKPPPTAKQVISQPSTKRCVSRRNFRIRLRQPKGVTITGATVVVNGKTVKTVKRTRITAPVDLRGLPKGRFAVKITVFTSAGQTITSTRRYHTCVPKRHR